MEKERQTTPPPIDTDTASTSDMELLHVISANAECAHVLAAIAAGGDPMELISTLIPHTEPSEKNTENTSEQKSEPEPQVGMYQSAAITETVAEESCPSFLSHIRPDFWDF